MRPRAVRAAGSVALNSGAVRRGPLPELVSYLEGLSEPHILFDAQYRILAANAAYRAQFAPRGSVPARCAPARRCR